MYHITKERFSLGGLILYMNVRQTTNCLLINLKIIQSDARDHLKVRILKIIITRSEIKQQTGQAKKMY